MPKSLPEIFIEKTKGAPKQQAHPFKESPFSTVHIGDLFDDMVTYYINARLMPSMNSKVRNSFRNDPNDPIVADN